jgi:hypothetical protein
MSRKENEEKKNKQKAIHKEGSNLTQALPCNLSLP